MGAEGEAYGDLIAAMRETKVFGDEVSAYFDGLRRQGFQRKHADQARQYADDAINEVARTLGGACALLVGRAESATVSIGELGAQVDALAEIERAEEAEEEHWGDPCAPPRGEEACGDDAPQRKLVEPAWTVEERVAFYRGLGATSSRDVSESPAAPTRWLGGGAAASRGGAAGGGVNAASQEAGGAGEEDAAAPRLLSQRAIATDAAAPSLLSRRRKG